MCTIVRCCVSRYQSKYVSKPAPVASTLNACRSFGAITEALDSVLHSYITTNPDQVREKKIDKMFYQFW